MGNTILKEGGLYVFFKVIEKGQFERTETFIDCCSICAEELNKKYNGMKLIFYCYFDGILQLKGKEYKKIFPPHTCLFCGDKIGCRESIFIPEKGKQFEPSK